jgi:hypothetical protein
VNDKIGYNITIGDANKFANYSTRSAAQGNANHAAIPANQARVGSVLAMYDEGQWCFVIKND